jgi:hypothetical protein
VSAFRTGEDEALGATTSDSGGSYELSFTVLAPDAPEELRLESEERRFADTSLTVGFSESITQGIGLPSISISTVEELQAIQTDSGFPLDGFYKQTADIDASGTATWNGGEGFEPIGDETVPFSGSFNGNGFVIEGLSSEIGGLFGFVAQESTLQTVSLKSINIQGSGGLAGVSKANIRNSFVDGTVDGSGGLVGRNDGGNIRDSESKATVNGRSSVGGLVGRNIDGELKNSRASGDVTGVVSDVGGLVGINNGGNIESSEASGDVDGGGDSGGGLVGTNANGTIQSSMATGNVVGGDRVGGLAGVSGGVSGAEILDSKATGSVSSIRDEERFAGGLVGDNSGIIRNSEATRDVVGRFAVGGLVGRNRGDIQSSNASGNAEGSDWVGGLVGGNSGGIQESSATGNVEAPRVTGGLVGNNDGSVEASFSVGDVTGSNELVGGLVGENEGGTVRSSYAMGSVTGGNEVGGLAGTNTNDGEIEECYAVGAVSGDEDVGGLIGANGANVSTSFWDTEATGQDDGVGRGTPDGTTGLTTDEMQGESAQDNMDGFDFQDTWQVVSGDYPALFWEEN